MRALLIKYHLKKFKGKSFLSEKSQPEQCLYEMHANNSLQKHLCVVFLTSAVLATFVLLKKNHYNNNETLLANIRAKQAERDRGFKTALLSDYDEHHWPTNKTTVYILGLFEMNTKWGNRPEGVSEIAAARLAISHVNQMNLLQRYELRLIVNDTKCDPGVGVDAFFHAIYSREPFVMLLGSGYCSNVTESLAHIVPYWNILQISYGSTSPTLSDRKKFPLFFRTVAPDSTHNFAKIAFVKHFGWKVVATFAQSENRYLLPLNGLIKEMENENISCATSITFSWDNYRDQLKVLKDRDIRIIIGAFSNDLAPGIFCEIYKLGMYGEDYVWIVQDRDEIWWRRSEPDCDLEKATAGLILVGPSYNQSGSISGLDADRFHDALQDVKIEADISKYARLVYDAIWSMALSLKHADDDGKLLLLQDFNYKRNDIVCELMRSMSNLNFTGISGPLKFIGADRVGNSILRQLQPDGLGVRDVALYDLISGRMDFECATCQNLSWLGEIPIAQRILKIIPVTIPTPLAYTISFLSIAGVFFALGFLYFNLRFRRLKTVKLSSPKLNNVAVIGCILVYFSVFFSYSTHFFCTFRVYLLSAGFSLAFGSMFAKTYRVHRIFTYKNNKLLKDQQLIALIFVPLLIDAIILGLWLMIDPLQPQFYNLTLVINSRDRGVVYQPQVIECRSHNTMGWFVAMYGYKALILIMSVFMAWETRHVKVQALNDSQYIGVCVYLAVFSAILSVLSGFLRHYVIVGYLARNLSILMSASATLFLLFLPKLRSVLFHRSRSFQDPIMQSMGLKLEHKTRRFIRNDPKELMNRLEIQNKVYRCELESLDMEIRRLEELIERRAGTIDIYTITKSSRNSSWPNYSFDGNVTFLSSQEQAAFRPDSNPHF